MLRKIRRSLPFLFGCLMLFMAISIASDIQLIFKKLQKNDEVYKELSQDIDLNERKIDALQDKFYQERINSFLGNNKVHYSKRFEDGELVQIVYDSYIKDPHNGFNTTAKYELFACAKYPDPCLSYDEDKIPAIEFKDTEVISNFSVEKIKPNLVTESIYLIKVDTNLLKHLYIFMPIYDEENNSSFYKLINPITDQGWLRQYEGEKQIKNIEINDESINMVLDILPIHYQVYPQTYNIEIKEDNQNSYKMVFTEIVNEISE